MNVPRPKTESAVNVTRLGYVAFETPDVDRLVEYYTKILDFTVVDRSPEGAFLTTGFDHHCVVITRAAATKGRTATGYEISEPLDDAERRLRERPKGSASWPDTCDVEFQIGDTRPRGRGRPDAFEWVVQAERLGNVVISA